jgi:hypothetical protein
MKKQKNLLLIIKMNKKYSENEFEQFKKINRRMHEYFILQIKIRKID